MQRAEEELKRAGVPLISIAGRNKRLYSFYQKLVRKDNDVAKVYDLVAIRIIVPTVADCYATLGILHKLWKPMRGRIKDYISQPKPNHYQSLHTTIFDDNGESVEFQIRTPEMQEEAEFGIAAHWHYDEHGSRLPMRTPLGKRIGRNPKKCSQSSLTWKKSRWIFSQPYFFYPKR